MEVGLLYVILTRTNFKGKVCPKEGTRVRILGMYHDMAWYTVQSNTGEVEVGARGWE